MMEAALSGLVSMMYWKALVEFCIKLTLMMYYGREMNALNFGVKKTQF